MDIHSEQDALNALDRITAELEKPRKADLGQVCATYKVIKPFLQGVLFLIEKIPVVGKKIVGAIRFLITVADLACPAT